MESRSYILIIIIFISLIFTGCNNNSVEIGNLKNEVQIRNKKNQELQNNISILERDIKGMEDKQNQPVIEMNKKGEELIKNLKNMDSLSKVVGAYYYRLDGGASEGYSETLYKFYEKEGMENLIEILNNKDETTIEGVIQLLANEYVFGENVKLIDDMIGKLNSINSSKLNDKKKYIILRLLAQCYLVKSNINIIEKSILTKGVDEVKSN